MTPLDLINFELEVAEAFNKGLIRAPVHLAGGNEADLISIFKDVGPNDWVATQWRSHFHCLLRGVPRDRLMADILAGKSITLTYPDYRIISSAIVGGILPIALGIAWSIKRAGGREKVWAFCGDMTATTGIFDEVGRYAAGFELPLRIVIEDNGLSVCSPTAETWGTKRWPGASLAYRHYGYELSPWPHAGSGKRVNF
jgi:pyruvate dehydrogenase E1 component alpha subunit